MSPRLRKSERWVPLVPGDEDWTPIKTPCVTPEPNFEAKDPRVVMLVDTPKTKTHPAAAAAIRLTVGEAEELAAELSQQATAIRNNTYTRKQP